LQRDLEREFNSEKASYDKFACFCRDSTEKQSRMAQASKLLINDLSADIEERTTNRINLEQDRAETAAYREQLVTESNNLHARCKKENLAYQANLADLNSAISGLVQALAAMTDARTTTARKAAFLQIRSDLLETLTLTEVVSKASATHQKAMALLQSKAGVDPNDPEYDFHSDDIMDVMKTLLSDYRQNEQETSTEYAKAQASCSQMAGELRDKIKLKKDRLQGLDQSIPAEQKRISESRKSLVEEQASLEDTDLYLKDLTQLCEDRAQDWDQRFGARTDELNALKEAQRILGTAVTMDSNLVANDVSVRSMFLQKPGKDESKPKVNATETKVDAANVKKQTKSLSFLQDASAKQHAASSLLRGEASLNARRDRALSLLQSEGQRLGSLTLSTLALRSAADPFKKVKGLLQKLVERLLQESAAEATKKGFCDEELGKANKERDFRYSEAQDINAAIEQLQAKRDVLKAEIRKLTRRLGEQRSVLKHATSNREEEKRVNEETVAVAKEGKEATSKALLLLKVAFKQLAKGSALAQVSPVTEDTKGPGFSGSYHGAQGSTVAIFTLLETIEEDFDRTIRKTEAEEERAASDFKEFQQATTTSIAGLETKVNLDREDLKTTYLDMESKTDDLQTAVNLLDTALKELEMLKPACIDTGMSFKERTEKREEEMAALQKALKILDN